MKLKGIYSLTIIMFISISVKGQDYLEKSLNGTYIHKEKQYKQSELMGLYQPYPKVVEIYEDALYSKKN